MSLDPLPFLEIFINSAESHVTLLRNVYLPEFYRKFREILIVKDLGLVLF